MRRSLIFVTLVLMLFLLISCKAKLQETTPDESIIVDEADASKKVASEEISSEAISSEKVGSEEVASKEVTSKEVTSEEVTSDEITSKEDAIPQKVRPDGDFITSGTDDSNYIELSKINEDIWIHTSYQQYEGYRTPSNGLIVITSEGTVLIDTPWSNDQTKELIKLLKEEYKEEIELAIITHAHTDRIGGIDTLLEHKIDVRSTKLTEEEADKNGFQKPSPVLDNNPLIEVGDTSIEVYYPGEGHTIDNITVWLPEYKVLFGGCLIKSLSSRDLGSIADANVSQWPESVQNVKDKYPDTKVVIPGHGKSGGVELIDHTLNLLNEN